jgi:hypothetical protein
LITILVPTPEPNVMEINEPREYIHNLWNLSFMPAYSGGARILTLGIPTLKKNPNV